MHVTGFDKLYAHNAHTRLTDHELSYIPQYRKVKIVFFYSNYYTSFNDVCKPVLSCKTTAIFVYGGSPSMTKYFPFREGLKHTHESRKRPFSPNEEHFALQNPPTTEKRNPPTPKHHVELRDIFRLSHMYAHF